MGVKNPSKKRLAIDNDQRRIVLAVAGSSAIVVFCLMASWVLFSKIRHQQAVISKKETALEQLQTNEGELEKLVSSYTIFDNEPESVLGNTGESNAKVVLDSLPSKYDYAALLTSVEKILVGGGFSVLEISGNDLELEAAQSSDKPTPIEIPLRIGVQTTYDGAKLLMSELERSIRPFNVQNVELTGKDSLLNVYVDIVTYYQPETSLGIQTEEVN